MSFYATLCEYVNDTFPYLVPENWVYNGHMLHTHIIVLAILINIVGYNNFLTNIIHILHINKKSIIGICFWQTNISS